MIIVTITLASKMIAVTITVTTMIVSVLIFLHISLFYFVIINILGKDSESGVSVGVKKAKVNIPRIFPVVTRNFFDI